MAGMTVGSSLFGAQTPPGTLGRGNAPLQPPRGQTYVDPSNGHVMTWSAPSQYEAETGTSSGKYLDSGQVDSSWESAHQFDTTLAAKQSAANQLIAAISGSGGGNAAPVTIPSVTPSILPQASGASAETPTPYDNTAATAAYTQAKQSTANALNAGLKSLQSTMASRGLAGSGMEAQGQSSLYASGLDTLSGVDAASAATQAGEAFTANQSALSRAEQARETDQSAENQTSQFNANNSLSGQEFNANLKQQQTAQKLNSLVSAYGGLY